MDNSNGAAGNIAELMFISGELELKSGTIGECSDAGIVSGGIECAAISGGMSITGETTYGGEISITGGSFGPVSVDSGGSAEINGGSFSEIWAFDISGTAIALSSVLADGYAFYDQTNGEVQNGTATKLTNVTVKKHTHSGSPCACGYTCSHPEMDSTTGKCTGCDELIAQAGHLLLPTVGKSGIIGVYETRRKEHGL